MASSAASSNIWFNHTNEKEILVLYTGGSIGMVPNSEGVLVPAPNVFVKRLSAHIEMHDKEFYKAKFGTDKVEDILCLPLTDNNIRVIYRIKEYEKLLDSSNMGANDWEKIAWDIKQYYAKYHGFVILHGTDTLAFTASALSFMLKNLGKPVIVTGAQLPIFNIRNDGIHNLLNSLIIASSYHIPEVTVFFGSKLLRGNRTTKIDTNSFEGFESPHRNPLLRTGIEFLRDFPPYDKQPSEGLIVSTNLNRNVVILTIFPDIQEKMLKCSVEPPIEGVILRTYGAGNVPSNRPELIEIIKKATSRGVIVVNVSQTLNGSVKGIYETNKILADAGVISGFDMTVEAAFTKLKYVLSMANNLTVTEKRDLMQRNIRGELSGIAQSASVLTAILQ